jgi:Protein of unknown function (DUF3631)
MAHPDEYSNCAEAVARELRGEPNRHLSNGKQLKWGTHGSLSLKIESGIFYDHEIGGGGGIRWFVGRELGLDDAGISEWLSSRGYIAVTQPKIVVEYSYTDAGGKLLYQVVRLEPKDFRQRKPDGAGGWTWSVKGVRQVPYRLPALVEAIKLGQPVLVVEGEKDTDNLHALGVVATCNAGGAGKWPKALNEHFRGADVVLVPDNDKAGYDHINVVAKALTGIALRVRVLMLPELPDKGDVSDWLAAGGTADNLQALTETALDWINSETQQAADQETDRILNELAGLSDFAYEQRSTEEAHNLHVRGPALDNEVQRRRTEIRGSAPLRGDWVVAPWEEAVDGAALLTGLIGRIRRHVVCTAEQALTAALWTLQAWAHADAATYSPILLITSAEPNSGKTTLINVITFLVPRGLPCVGISEAGLFRSIGKWDPTIIVDEADTALVENEPLRAILNSGWVRGQGTVRCIGDSKDPTYFHTFCPKLLGMKGRSLPDTTMSRCIVVEMRRKKSEERAEHFKHIDDDGLSELRRKCFRWAMDNGETLKAAESEMPSNFDNRLGDNWRLMFSIADLIGGEWQEKARQAAVIVSKVIDSDDLSLGTQLLEDIRLIFSIREDYSTGAPVKYMTSEDLATTLNSMIERPWSEWRGGKFTPRALAKMLRVFNIYSGSIRTGAATQKGYQLAHFRDAFERYLGGGPEDHVDANGTS